MILTGDYEFIAVLDSVTKKLKLGNAVEGPFRVFWQNPNIVVIQRKKHVERITTEKCPSDL